MKINYYRFTILQDWIFSLPRIDFIRVSMTDIVHSDESYEIMGACFHVYEEIGNGFLEAVYHECLEIELEHQTIPFVSQKDITLSYRQRELENTYRADFICFDKVLLELKSVDELHEKHESQLMNYLEATELQLGILVNFGGHPKLEYKRIVN